KTMVGMIISSIPAINMKRFGNRKTSIFLINILPFLVTHVGPLRPRKGSDNHALLQAGKSRLKLNHSVHHNLLSVLPWMIQAHEDETVCACTAPGLFNSIRYCAAGKRPVR